MMPHLRIARCAALALACATTVLVTACSDSGAAGGREVVVRDSAGVTIVENSGPVWRDGEGWRLADEPTVDIGVVEGDARYQLHRPSAATRLSNGTIVVANAGTQELRYYDATGRHLVTAGGKGGGPGEFDGLRRIARAAGDTVIAWDWSHGRLSRFDANGRFIASFSLSTVAPFSFSDFRGALGDGGFLLTPGPSFIQLGNNEVRRDTLVVVSFTPQGEVRDTIGIFAGTEQFSSSELRMQMPLPFGRTTFAMLSGDQLLVAENANAELAFHRLDGTLTRIVRFPATTRPLTSEALSAYKARRVEIASQDFRSAVEKLMEIVTFPSQMPQFESVRVDALGNVWLAEPRLLGNEPGSWIVFDAEGRQLGTVAMPAGFDPYEIGPDYVLGLWKDELDVEHIRLHALHKRDTGAARDAPGARAYALAPR